MKVVKDDIEIAELTYRSIRYRRVASTHGKYERGTVFLGDRLIPSYPSLKRAYNLRAAIQKEFGEQPFIVEEKVDGANIRIVGYKENILAFTRGGYICPYSTELLQNRDNFRTFFQDYPNYVLFSELIGANPYNHISAEIYGFEPRFLVFDIFKADSEQKVTALLPDERMELIKRYSLPSVTVFGKKSIAEYEELLNILETLDNGNREGIVLKSLQGFSPRIKYVTFSACIGAIADHMVKAFEQSAPETRNLFFLAACYLTEVKKEVSAEITSKMGETILSRLRDAIQTKKVAERYRLQMTKQTWSELQQLLSKYIPIRVLSEKNIDEGRIEIVYEKIYPRSTAKLREFLSGRTYVD